MKLLKTLGNPFVLVAQGFTFGAILFFSTHPGADLGLAAAPLLAPISAAL